MTERRVMTDDPDSPVGLAPSPLLRRDPPAVGDIVLTGRLAAHDAGMTYAGRRHDDDVTVVMLTAGAEVDSYARARFRQAAGDLEEQRPGVTVAAEEEPDLAPWVAVASTSWGEGLTLGNQLLRAVTLEDRPSIGVVQGPDFRPHWWERVSVGRWRLWPLPWPSRLSSAGRWTFLASFVLVCAIAALALWLTVLVFRNQPPPAPTPGPGPGPNPPSSPAPSIPTPLPQPLPAPTNGQTIPPIV